MPIILPKKKGRKKGCNVDLLSLNSGGLAGHFELTRQQCDSQWRLEEKGKALLDDSDDMLYSFSSSTSTGEYDDDEILDYNELEDHCVMDMKGLMIFPVEKLADVIWNQMCCKKCTLSWHTQYMNDFIKFTVRYEDEVTKVEGRQLFGSKRDWMEWQLNHHKPTTELYSIFCGRNRGVSVEDIVCTFFSIAEETLICYLSIWDTW